MYGAIFKKNDSRQLGNYRPVSNRFKKKEMFERICDRMIRYAIVEQCGLRPNSERTPYLFRMQIVFKHCLVNDLPPSVAKSDVQTMGSRYHGKLRRIVDFLTNTCESEATLGTQVLSGQS